MTTSNFDFTRLLTTVFHPRPGERVGIFIDLGNPAKVGRLEFLRDFPRSTRRIAYEEFYQGLQQRSAALPFASVAFFAFTPTGGSNLDLPDTVVSLDGRTLDLVADVLPHLDIVLYFSTYSATAPITSIAKKMGFRGATLHGCNDIILQSGLAKNYDEVSAKAEQFRAAVTRCDDVVIEFATLGETYRLTVELGKQEAQKSHGLCRTPGEIANLPAGEIYWVPTSAHGQFPHKFKDGTLALFDVADGYIRNATLLHGHPQPVAAALTKFQSDPATGVLGELGLGTQVLPVAGADIQDEKILGTFHVATGRSDHLGGTVGPESFREKKNATHEDILFAPHKTPEIANPGVWMHKDGHLVLLLQDYQPSEFVKHVALGK